MLESTTLKIDFSNIQGQLTPPSRVKSVSNSSKMLWLSLFSMNEEDPIKIEGARVATIQNIDFSNTKGQLTPQSEVRSGRNANSYEMLYLFLLPAIMKKIRSKLKALEWSQYKIMIFQTLKGS